MLFRSANRPTSQQALNPRPDRSPLPALLRDLPTGMGGQVAQQGGQGATVGPRIQGLLACWLVGLLACVGKRVAGGQQVAC